MKQILLLFVFLANSLLVKAQSPVPQKFNYQGVALNQNGSPVANQSLGLRLSIFDPVQNTTEYIEIHNTTTDLYGLYNLQIGAGNPLSGSLSNVTWMLGNKFLKIEIDITGGSNYSLVGTSPFMSVPYALVSENTINGVRGATGATGIDGLHGVDGSTGATGYDGNDGENGFNSLIKTSPEPVGLNCSNGGLKIETGLDTNRDNVLDNGEVTSTNYLCR